MSPAPEPVSNRRRYGPLPSMRMSIVGRPELVPMGMTTGSTAPADETRVVIRKMSAAASLFSMPHRSTREGHRTFYMVAEKKAPRSLGTDVALSTRWGRGGAHVVQQRPPRGSYLRPR